MQTDNPKAGNPKRPFFHRSWVQIISWSLLGAFTSGGVLIADMCVNLFDWDPELILKGSGGIFAVDVIALIGVFLGCHKLARVTESRRVRNYALVVIGIGAITWSCYLPAEDVTATKHEGGYLNIHIDLSRTTPSPFWFRVSRVLLAALPAGFILAAARRKSGEQVESVAKPVPVAVPVEAEKKATGEDFIAAKLARIENLLHNGHIDQRERDEARRQILLSV